MGCFNSLLSWHWNCTFKTNYQITETYAHRTCRIAVGRGYRQRRRTTSGWLLTFCIQIPATNPRPSYLGIVPYEVRSSTRKVGRAWFSARSAHSVAADGRKSTRRFGTLPLALLLGSNSWQAENVCLALYGKRYFADGTCATKWAFHSNRGEYLTMYVYMRNGGSTEQLACGTLPNENSVVSLCLLG